ncbi:hypothetical protein Gotur_029523, partial [Gossypium turneri]
MKRTVEGLERALQNCEARIEYLEGNEDHQSEQLHYFQDQVAQRDHIMGEALVQIQEVAEHLQTFAIQVDILSVKYELESDQGQKLASLLREIKVLSIRDMSEKMRESQNDMMAKLTQLIVGGSDKGKGPMANVEEGNDDEPLYPPGFTPPHVRTQAKYSHKSIVTIVPQQFQ